MKDYIDVFLNDGSSKKMEVVSIFDINGYDFHYIIYSELDKSNYYLAKYVGDNIVNLSTEFDKYEFSLANSVFKGIINRWI